MPPNLTPCEAAAVEPASKAKEAEPAEAELAEAEPVETELVKAESANADLADFFHIDGIPSEALVIVFSFLHLQALLTVVPEVSRRWRFWSAMAIRNQQSLTLIINNIDRNGQTLQMAEISRTPFGESVYPLKNGSVDLDDFPGEEDTRVVVSSHDELNYKRMVKSMPHIRKLVILQQLKTPDQMKHTTVLLKGWASTLEHLKLWFGFYYPVEQTLRPKRDCDRLLRCINNLGKLRHLTFFFPGHLLYRVSRLDLPIIRQLEEFNFHSHDPCTVLVESLQKYAAPNDQLRQIAIGNEKCWGDLMEPEEPLAFSLRFTGGCCLDSSIRPDFPGRFLNLTSLCFELSRNFSELTCLQVLPHLTHLNILSNFFNVKPLAILETIPDEHLDQYLPRLPTVKVLTIKFVGYGCGVFSCKRLPLMFPVLEVLLLKVGYRSCAYCEKIFNLDEKAKAKCSQLMEEQWKESFPNLKIQIDWHFELR